MLQKKKKRFTEEQADCQNWYVSYHLLCGSMLLVLQIVQKTTQPKTDRGGYNADMEATFAMIGIIGIVGVIFIITCVCLITCLCAPCCLCYKLCRKPRNQRQIVVTNTVANMPQPHYSPSGYQAQPPDYQAVAGDEGSTAPNTPPPSYMECTSPWYPAPFVPGQAMSSLSPPNQPSAPPLPSDEIDLPPYNPI